MRRSPLVVLSIAGFDPSSGAGTTADIKTAAAHGCYAVTCITAVTVQSTAGVRRVEPLPPELVRQTLDELWADVQISALRIGMLGSGSVASAVADWLEVRRPQNVVLDPVLKSSSGADLLDPAGMAVVRERLLRLAMVITPNLAEAEALTGLAVKDLPGMKGAAKRLHELGARNVVITGGHLPTATDLLSPAEGEQREYPGERLESGSTHGTGCAFATALACQLALGKELPEAVRLAKYYVREAIRRAYPLGRGVGPMNHLWRLRIDD